MADTKPPSAKPNNEAKPTQQATTESGENPNVCGEVGVDKNGENGLGQTTEIGVGENGEVGENGGVGGDFQPKDRLDHHLAIIEEQFRKGFDERYSVNNNSAVHRSLYEDPEETIRTNKIFREVSRCLGEDWKKVYEVLMKSQPKPVLEAELSKISKNQPIIQGYRALMSWKEVTGSGHFSLMTLVQTLNDLALEEVADVVLHIIDNNEVPDKKPTPNRKRTDLGAQKNASILDNRRLLLISKKVGGAYEGLGKVLGVSEEELGDIKKAEGDTYQGCFKVLWAWKDARSGLDNDVTDVEALKSALEKSDLKKIADEVDSIV